MRISDWSSDVCSSDLALVAGLDGDGDAHARRDRAYMAHLALDAVTRLVRQMGAMGLSESNPVQRRYRDLRTLAADAAFAWDDHVAGYGRALLDRKSTRLKLQSLMRISYAVFCLTKKNNNK